MGIVPDINQFGAALDAFQAIFVQAQSEVLDEGLRQQMVTLAAQLKQSQTEFMAEYPKGMASMEQEGKAIQQEAEDTLAKAQQLRLDQEKAAQMPKMPEKPVEEPLDPALGQKLRNELLDRFGNGQNERREATPQNISRSEFHEMLRKSGVIK
jgi:hypothetical protein